MRDLVRMVLVLTCICLTAGAVLSAVEQATREPRALQLLKAVKEPAIKAIFPDIDNDPIADKIELDKGKTPEGEPITMSVFPAKKDGKLVGLAYEAASGGYHGNITVMVGTDPEGKIAGIRITQHTETPGLGARVEEPQFTEQFKGKVLSDDLKVGGQIDGVSGASFSSNGVVNAVRLALEMFPEVIKEVH